MSAPKGRYSYTEVPLKVEPVRSLSPPPGEIHLKGSGWNLKLPGAIAIAVVSALGARFIPAPTQSEVETRAEQRLRDLRDAEFREEVKRELRGLREVVDRNSDDTRNRFALIEARLNKP